MPFSVPFSEVWVPDLTVKVVLPEWATDIKVDVPFEVQEVGGWVGISVGVRGWGDAPSSLVSPRPCAFALPPSRPGARA